MTQAPNWKFLDRVYNGDILVLLRHIPSESVDCAYADPDYNVGRKYNSRSYIRSFDDYISWCMHWSEEIHRVLKDRGNFFVINYPKNNAYLRTRYLDGAFHSVHEYVWIYNTNIGHSKNRFTTAHRSILHCTKSPKNNFYKKNVSVPYLNPGDKRIKKLMARKSPGRMPYSWLYYDLVKNVSRLKTFHSCQIPDGLSRTLISSCTRAGDVVLIAFGGSGSEIMQCVELGRHFISAELDPRYCKLISRRLQSGGKVPEDARMITLMRGHGK